MENRNLAAIDAKTWTAVQKARKQILAGKIKVADSVSDLK